MLREQTSCPTHLDTTPCLLRAQTHTCLGHRPTLALGTNPYMFRTKSQACLGHKPAVQHIWTQPHARSRDTNPCTPRCTHSNALKAQASQTQGNVNLGTRKISRSSDQFTQNGAKQDPHFLRTQFRTHF